ncbi:hypothetical protein CASFOL_007743 [Castilleja foliolosa]|uniref:NADH:quinone oxidoreductase/Mrp antiporter transmembrane domain-containing protein n=1 Tax=Castilleja foliolosa TaxID=1961234 RepID=A0ABD3E5I0_9LAMI
MGVLAISLYGSTEPTFNFEILANQCYPVALEIIFYIGFFIAFAVKLPIIPLHTWLPDTHGEAHYSTCMLLAGILLKMGAYGLVRINMELFPHAHSIFSPWLIIIGATQIIYAASTSLGQRNLKKRIAYSSVSHMGFIIIGIGSITDMGLNGALLQIISHGFIGAALFFLAGTTYDRIRLVYLDEMGGIAIPMPKIFTMFSSFSMASLALPGMSGFVAELIVFFGLITSQKYLLMTKALITFVMAIGMILTPIYLLSMLRQMFYGYKIFNISNSYFSDSGQRELFLLISIFLPILGIGMYPDFLLSLSVEKVEVILSKFIVKSNHRGADVAKWIKAVDCESTTRGFNISRPAEFKKRIAYSSVSHMGFIIIGIGSITDMGLNGALLQIISHGFIGAALFFLAGTTYDRIRLVYLDEMGGIAIPMPKIFTMFSSFSMASLALPGMSGFVAELIVFFGLITSQKYLKQGRANNRTTEK